MESLDNHAKNGIPHLDLAHIGSTIFSIGSKRTVDILGQTSPVYRP